MKKAQNKENSNPAEVADKQAKGISFYRHMSKRKRIVQGHGPREILEKCGVQELADWELIAILLGSGKKGKGVAPLAQELLKVIDSLDINKPITPDMLSAVSGIGLARATRIIAALELGRRVYKPSHKLLETPSDVLPFILHYRDRPQEHFLAISLNGANEVIGVRLVSVGLINKALVHPREVFAGALEDRASSLMIAHNHPTGIVAPSAADRKLTERLRLAGELLDIPVVDHMIFSASGDYYSFLEEGDFLERKGCLAS